jgi:DNA-binding CsgD family transcriptional regulator
MSYNRGEGHGKAKLSEIDVLTIRDLLSNSGYTQKQIGEMFGVNSRTVSGIKQGTVWGHL